MAARHPAIELEEIENVGLAAAHACLDRFEPARGNTLTTFLQLRTKGAMTDHLRNVDWVPRLVRSRAAKLKAARDRCWGRLGRMPSNDELAAEMGLSAEQFEAFQKENTEVGVGSLSSKISEHGAEKERHVHDIEHDRRAEDPRRRHADVDFLRRATRGFNKAERLLVIGLYFEQDSMKQVGRQLGLSESRISQMHSALLPRMRHNLDERRSDRT